jgi:prepilin-type N-terminal cleavage/methylation domain-containing protein
MNVLPGTGKRSAFTLIELLSVVAITATLAALLIAGTQKVKKMGAQAATVNTMRNIGNAIHQYTADNDSRLPGPLTVAVFNWVDANTENTICSLGRYIHPYLGSSKHEPWLAYAARSHFPALDCPALSPSARKSEVAQFVKLDYPHTSEDNIFGSPPTGGMAFSSRASVTPQPKMLAALTSKARNSPILTTADQMNWSANPLLPSRGVFDGKRLYLFLDGSVEGPVAREGMWSR